MTSETSQISEREREILRLVALGATNQQIANQLNISVNTVKVHLRNIFGKIGVASRTEATVSAIRMGLVQVESGSQAEPAEPAEPAELVGALAPAGAEPLVAEAAPAAGSPPPAPADLAPGQQAAALEEAAPAPPRPAVAAPARRPSWLLAALGVAVIGLLAALAYTLLSQRGAAEVAGPQAAPAQPQADRWRARADVPQPRADFAVAAYENKLYVIGGRGASGPSAAVTRYDPAADSWVALNEKPTAVEQAQAVAIGGRIYVPGGEAGGAVLDVFESYDPRTQRWETLPPLPAPRSRYALAQVEGQLYLFGGWDGAAYRKDVLIYRPDSREWRRGTDMSVARRGAGAAVIESRVYVIGGEGAGGPLRLNERYDPTGAGGGQWESAAPLPAPVAAPAVVGFSGVVNLIFVFDAQARAALKYNPSPETWSTESLPADAAVSGRAIPLGSSVFSFGPAAEGAFSEYKALYASYLPNASFDP